MNRASAAPASRAAQALISRKGVCNCGQALTLERQVFDAKSYLVAVIVRLGELAVSPADPADPAGLALADARRALSVLEATDDRG